MQKLVNAVAWVLVACMAAAVVGVIAILFVVYWAVAWPFHVVKVVARWD